MSYTRIEATDFVISADSVTAPAWSNNAYTLTSFYTASSNLTGSYFIDVYNLPYTASTSEVQFSIAYGRSDGLGSAPLNSSVSGKSPTRITFGQYRNLIYGDAETAVSFGTGNSSSLDLIAIQVDRNRYKESLFPGTFNLFLTSGSETIKLTDNSTTTSTITYVDGGRVYTIVSGSNGVTTTAQARSGNISGSTAQGNYGLFLPDIGLILLNPLALTASISQGGVALSLDKTSTTVAASSQNHDNIFRIIKDGANFSLNSQETISSNYVFVRIKNAEYNYTTNPSIISGSSGEMVYSNFINSPQTYPTTVGMYNDNNELLAVAKLSKPLVKDFTKEALIRVKLDW
jgi:biopolymer transport protein ExbD